METTIGIVGAGPAGLLLSYLLNQMGIDNQVLEHRGRTHVEQRVRAGQLDHASVEFLRRVGLGQRMDTMGLPQRGLNLRFRDQTHRIDLEDITDGRYCFVYGQSELTKDLARLLDDAGHPATYGAQDIQFGAPDAAQQTIRYTHDGTAKTIKCRYIVGCDGAHGPTRKHVAGAETGISKSSPYAWVGILSQTPPVSDELTYIYHPKGFALWSMRSKSVSRTYLQCDAADTPDCWSDDRFWGEMQKRLGPDIAVNPGETTERIVVRMQGYVAPRFRRGNVLLAGDAAHIVPPSAAKGLNLAIADIASLSAAFQGICHNNQQDALEIYAAKAMQRAWEGQQFSWHMTDLLHAAPGLDSFENNLRLTQLDALVASPQRLRLFSETYVGAKAF